MSEVDRDKAIEVWKLLDDAKSPYRIGQMGVTSQRTAERLQTVLVRAGRHESEADIAMAIPDWTLRRVQRTIGWFEERPSASSDEPIPAVQPNAAPALAKHHRALADVARRFLDDLHDLDRFVHPVYFASQVTDEPVLTFRGEAWQTYGAALFEQLKQHIAGSEQWDAFDALKRDLVGQVTRILENPRPDYFYPGTTEPVHGLLIHVPDTWGRSVATGGSVRLEIPDGHAKVVHELQRVVINGWAGGHCDLCPD